MAQGKIPKWQKDIEEILEKKFQGDELQEQLKKAFNLLDLIKELEPPSGDMKQLVSVILTMASRELNPMATALAGFQLGMAYERYQNANRARES